MKYVPAIGPVPATYMLVGEAPGGDEEAKGVPFVGMAGQLLDRVLVRVGLPRSECFITNVCHYRPPGNKIEEWLTTVKTKAERNGLSHCTDGYYHNDQVAEGVQELLRDIDRVQPEVIVAFGNAALWALTGHWGIMSWRGSELWYGDSRLIPVIHPAAVLRDMTQRPSLIRDLRMRVMDKMDHPEDGREPEWRFDVGSTDAVYRALRTLLWNLDQIPGPHWISNDVETRKGRIDCFGFGWSPRDAVCVPLINAQNESVWGDREAEVLDLSRRILTHPNARIIGQNFNYDAQCYATDPAFGYRVPCAHDTKVAQHVLLPGTDKDLVTLSAMYCTWHCYWKDDLQESNETLDDERRWRYNCRDCVVTYEVAMRQREVLTKRGFL